ncbi:hypothetical protein OAF44_01615 [Akkermansiaceae bacterium]|nr:hypothetical protein [Akkermansiaceae bacterium]
MTKARTLANFISDGSTLADGAISVSEVSGAAPLASPTFTGTLNISSSENNVALFDGSHATSTQMFLRNSNTGTDLYTVLGFAPSNNVSGATITTFAEEDFSEAANRTARLEIETRDNGNWMNRLTMGRAEAVFNDDSDATDFRVESNDQANMFLVDAGTNQVRIAEPPAPSSNYTMRLGNSRFLYFQPATGSNGFYNSAMGFSAHLDTAAVPNEIVLPSGRSTTGGAVIATQYDGKLEFYQYDAGTTSAATATASTHQKLSLGSTESVFNQPGENQDFRVESDNNFACFFVDAGNGRIGINQDVPGYTVDVVGGTNSGGDGVALRPLNESQTNILSFLGLKSTYYMQFMADSTNSGGSDYFQFHAGTQDANGELLFLGDGATTFNEGGIDRDFRVESDSDTHMLFVDASNNTLSVGTSLPPITHAVNNPTTNIARAAKIGEFVYGSVQNIYNSGNGRVFTVNAGSNGQAAMIQITAANHNGVIEQCFYLRNDAGTWVIIPGPAATSSNPPTITVVSNAGGTATFTVLGVGANPNYYNQGYLIYKTSNAVTLTT